LSSKRLAARSHPKDTGGIRIMRHPFILAAALTVSSVAFAQEAPNANAPVAPPPPHAPTLPSSDASPSPMERITFDGAVKRSLDLNPSAKVAAEEVARAHALMEQVRASSLPTLTGNGTLTRLDADRASGGIVVSPQTAIAGNITLNVPLIAPKSWVAWGHAGDQIDVAKANALDVRRTVAVATARAYLTIIAQKRLLETARSAVKNDQGHYDYTHQRLAGGVGNKIDEARAAQQLSTDQANLQRQEVALVRAREALGVLLAADGPVDSADDVMPAQMPALSDAMNESQSTRADVRARKRAASAAQRTVDDAWADYMPYLSLIAYPFAASPATATVPSTGWQAQLVLTVPIYDGGLRYGQEHERQSLRDEATTNLEATLRNARSDVRTAFEEMRRADEALAQARQASAFATQALTLATLAYRAGATTNLEVIDAERQARDAETQAAVAEDDARQARLDFLAASGRFP
jgi:outer membrane protein TolC